jgi:hypothetical protein
VIASRASDGRERSTQGVMSSISGISSFSSPLRGTGSSAARGGANGPSFEAILNSRLQSSSGTAATGDVQLLQALSQGSNLIGKTVSYSKNGGEVTAKGVVQSLRVENGKIHLVVGGASVPLDRVRGLSN